MAALALFKPGKVCDNSGEKEELPMRYKGKVYRPPSEAYSLIIQVTYGCSHNRCAFCDMYDDKRFALRPMEEIREDFRLARQVYRRVERVFLADGDALMRKTDELLEILAMVYSLFPECQRVTCYASPRSLQVKTEEELRRLRESGLKMVYMGLESGCDAVLERMQELSLEITPEDPAQAYELRVAAEVNTSGSGTVVWIAAGAAVVVVAAGIVIWSKRRKICTK